MKRFTTLFAFSFLFFSGSVLGQTSELDLNLAPDSSFAAPYSAGVHSGARTVIGPVDLDGDGKMEVIVNDYTRGGRAHVVENTGVGTWELIYSTVAYDSTNSSNNMRGMAAGDMDGDGNGEIIFLGGRSLVDTTTYAPGLFVIESNGDNSFADPVVWDYGTQIHDRWRAEQLTVTDIDGDGFDELLFGNNGSNGAFDRWDIVGVTGDIGSGFEVFQLEASWTSRNIGDDPVSRGGGSPYGMTVADLDGDGSQNIVMTSWNNYNFTNAWVTGVDSYEAPVDGAANAFLQASAADEVALFGCSAGDIDNDGRDEVVCPKYLSTSCTVVNYEDGENVQEVTVDNVAFDVIENCSGLGSTIGDLDGDGLMEVIGTGPAFGVENFNSGSEGVTVTINELVGADPEDSASWESDSIVFPRSATSFNTIVRDSSGVDMGTRIESQTSGTDGNPEFVSKLAYLGDVDGNGFRSLAVAFQGVNDYTTESVENFEPTDSTYTRTTTSSTAYDNRIFLSIVSSDGLKVAIEDIILPSDYVLSSNYPNPFNPSTNFKYTLPIDKTVSVNIFDVSGRLVRNLVDSKHTAAGTYEATWNGKDSAGNSVASGTYIYSLEYGNFRQTKTMVLIK